MDGIIIFIMCIVFMCTKCLDVKQETDLVKLQPKMNEFFVEDDDAFTEYVKIFKGNGGGIQ